MKNVDEIGTMFVTFKADRGIIKVIENLARSKGVSRSSFLRTIITNYIADLLKKGGSGN